MRFIAPARWAGSLLLALLAACGGGSGGPPPTKVTFSANPVSGNVQYGTMGTLTVGATVTNPPQESTFIVVEGLSPVFTDDVNVTAADASHFSVTLHTSPVLPLGHHTGTLQIKLCRNEQCALTVPGSPVAMPYDVAVVPAPLAAVPTGTTEESVHWGEDPGLAVNIAVSAAGLQWTASTAASWLQVDPTAASGIGDGNVPVHFMPGALALGDYADSVTVQSSDGQKVVVPVKLHVLPANFTAESGVPVFYAINGEPIAGQDMSFALDTGASTDWTLRSDAAWLTVTPTGTGLPATAHLQPDPSVGKLASGDHDANLTLSSGQADDLAVVSRLTLVPATLSTSVPAITLGGPKGRDLASPQSLTLGLDTGVNAYPWVLSSLPDWASSSSSSGNVSHAGTPVSFTPIASAVALGSTSATASFTATVNGDVVTTPLTINMNADQRRLLPSAWGVAFASTPTGTTLSRTLAIRDNFGGALAWTATSDSSWLHVTASGTTGPASNLVLTADPAALSNGTTSIATVTVTTAQAGVAPAKIRVGLWKDATGLAALTSLPGAGTYANMVADTIRPLVYVNTGAGTITAYNVYTATPVASVANVGTQLGAMAVSPEGGHLYAVDRADKSVAIVDLASLSKVGSLPPRDAVDYPGRIQVVRPNGVEVVLLSNGVAYSGGRAMSGVLARAALVATEDGSGVFGLDFDDGFSMSLQIRRWDLDYSEMSGGVLFATARAVNTVVDSAGDGNLALGPGAQTLYAALESDRCLSMNPDDLSAIADLPGGSSSTSSVAVTRSGRILCGAWNFQSPMSTDLWVHSAAGAVTASYKISADGRGVWNVITTADGFVAVASGLDTSLAFIPVGP